MEQELDPFALIVQHLMLFSSGATFTFVPSEALLALPYLQHIKNWDEPGKSVVLSELRGRRPLDVNPRVTGRLLSEISEEELFDAVAEVFERMETNEQTFTIFRDVSLKYNIRDHILRRAVASRK